MLDPTPDALPSRVPLDTHIAQPVNTLWIFGYGSLVWRPAFPHRERRAAFIEGWERRFWQGSTDHRGVPGAPGRVVTLVPCEGKTCWGMAYHVPGEDVAATLDQLDHRERGGYARRNVTLEFRDGRASGRADLRRHACQPQLPGTRGADGDRDTSQGCLWTERHEPGVRPTAGRCAARDRSGRSARLRPRSPPTLTAPSQVMWDPATGVRGHPPPLRPTAFAARAAFRGACMGAKPRRGLPVLDGISTWGRSLVFTSLAGPQVQF